MPRKKRKSGRLNPLVFIESPVNIVHKIPSPVYCSDHPATADVVPVDNNITWVSPQFVSVPTSGKPARRTRRALHCGTDTEVMTRSRTRNPSDHSVPVSKANDKYRPLAFLGDSRRGNQITSVCEDITMEDDDRIVDNIQDHVGSDMIAVNSDIIGSSSHLTGKITDTDAIASNRLPETDNHESPQFGRNVRKSLIYGNPLEEEMVDPGGEGDTDLQMVLTHNCDFNTPDISTLQLNTPKPEEKQESIFTSIKRKFTPDSGACKENRTKKHRKKRPCRLFSEDEEKCSGSEMDFDSIPRRRSQRLLRVKEDFFPNSQLQTPVDHFKMPVKVLAYDTPEEDYGIPVRQRRLKELKHARSKKKKVPTATLR